MLKHFTYKPNILEYRETSIRRHSKKHIAELYYVIQRENIEFTLEQRNEYYTFKQYYKFGKRDMVSTCNEWASYGDNFFVYENIDDFIKLFRTFKHLPSPTYILSLYYNKE